MSKVYNAGDVVMDGCEPFVIQIDDREKERRCHYCFTECDKLKKCAKCRMVMYCSKECQLKDWKDIHKFKECELLPLLEQDYNALNSRILARLILKITFDKKSRQKVYKLWDNRERKLDDLVSHIDKIDRLLVMSVTFYCEYLMELFDKLFKVKLNKDEMLHWFGVIKINTMRLGNLFQVDDVDKEHYAMALYIDGSALDHDCRPSCFCWFNGRKLQVRAMRKIDASVEEPTITYCPWDMDRDNRRKQLAMDYHFECQCKRCVNHEDKNLDFVRYDHLCNSQGETNWDEIVEFQRKLLGPHNPILTNGMFRQWLALMTRFHNNMSRHIRVKCSNLGKEVEKEFIITHGKEHSDYRKIVDILNKCKI